MEKFAKSLAKVGHVLVSRIGWIMQWVAGTEGLDRSDHLRNFVAMERLATMAMNGGTAIQNIAGGHSSLDVGF